MDGEFLSEISVSLCLCGYFELPLDN